MRDIQNAVGQYIVYRTLLRTSEEPDRQLYLAVAELTFDELFRKDVGKLIFEEEQIRLLVFDPTDDSVRQWIR